MLELELDLLNIEFNDIFNKLILCVNSQEKRVLKRRQNIISNRIMEIHYQIMHSKYSN